MMNDEQLLRYSRQILLPAIDESGQQRLLSSRVLLIGLGGLGSPVALYLAAAGVGSLHLVDDDRVELSNLARQIAHQTATIGLPKVVSAAQSIERLNPDVQVRCSVSRLSGEALVEAVRDADVVVDACDNLASRLAINEACCRTATPLVSGAAIRLEGQVAVFSNRAATCGCLACLYPDSDVEPEGCAESGVLGPVVGLIGCTQALETIRLLVGFSTLPDSRLLLLDAWSMQWQSLQFRPRPDCPVCSKVEKAV